MYSHLSVMNLYSKECPIWNTRYFVVPVISVLSNIHSTGMLSLLASLMSVSLVWFIYFITKESTQVTFLFNKGSILVSTLFDSLQLNVRRKNIKGINTFCMVSYFRNCINHSVASLSFVKLFIGIGGGFKPNKIFMMNFESPGLQTIAIAE